MAFLEIILLPFYWLWSLLIWLLSPVIIVASWLLSWIFWILSPVWWLFSLVWAVLLSFMFLVKVVLAVGLLSSIPATNFFVWKAKKIQNEHKFLYVSVVTMLVGFVMIVLELKAFRGSSTLSRRDSWASRYFGHQYFERDPYTENALKEEINDYFFNQYNDFPIVKNSKQFDMSLPKLFTHQGHFKLIIDMPDEILRDQSIYRALESIKDEKQVKRAREYQIIKFGVEASKYSQSEIAYISDIPFLGAKMELQKIKQNFKTGKTILWIREHKLTQLELKKLGYVIKAINKDPELKELGIVISVGDNRLFSQLQQMSQFSVFNFYSCYERRQEKVLDFFEEKLAEKLRIKDKLSIEKKAKFFLEYLDQDFYALKHFVVGEVGHRDEVQYINDVLNNVRRNLLYLEADPIRKIFLKNLARRMAYGEVREKNQWIDYADIYEFEKSKDLDLFLKKSLDDGILVQSQNRYRFRLGSIFRVFFEER